MDPAEEASTRVSFSPPLWIQRLDAVRMTLFELGVSEVCDLGCGSGKLMEQLKTARCTRLLIGVDLDRLALEEAWEKCQADFQDFHFRRDRQSDLRLYFGSILSCGPSLPFQVQCVTLCEVIEHYVIVTTPNADFNVLFDRSGFRHPDHKFEWTRAEFRAWAGDACQRYGYTVISLTGVGERPGTDVGFCTQIAVFQRAAGFQFRSREAVPETYELLHSVSFPVAAPRSFTDVFCAAVIYHTFAFARRFRLEDEEQMKLALLYENASELQSLSDGQFRQFLHLLHVHAAAVAERAQSKFLVELDGEFLYFPSVSSDDSNTED